MEVFFPRQIPIFQKEPLTYSIGNLCSINLDFNEQVSVFNETIMNIISNFVPNELINCDDRDLPWKNRYTKNLIVAINDFYKNICFAVQQYGKSFYV